MNQISEIYKDRILVIDSGVFSQDYDQNIIINDHDLSLSTSATAATTPDLLINDDSNSINFIDTNAQLFYDNKMPSQIVQDNDPLDEWGVLSIEETALLYKAEPVISIHSLLLLCANSMGKSNNNNNNNNNNIIPFPIEEDCEEDDLCRIFDGGSPEFMNKLTWGMILTTCRHRILSVKISDWFSMLSRMNYI